MMRWIDHDRVIRKLVAVNAAGGLLQMRWIDHYRVVRKLVAVDAAGV
jgi:hypothetical protein